MKFNKEKIKAKARKYAPYAQAVISLAAISAAAHYARKSNRQEEDFGIFVNDSDSWPRITISPNAFSDIRNGATLQLRQFDTPEKTVIQFTTRDDGFPAEADEQFNKYRKN